MQRAKSHSSRQTKSPSDQAFNQRKCLKCKKRHNECNCLKNELIYNRKGQANLFKSAHVDNEERELFVWAWYDVFHITSPCPDDPDPYMGDF